MVNYELIQHKQFVELVALLLRLKNSLISADSRKTNKYKDEDVLE